MGRNLIRHMLSTESRTIVSTVPLFSKTDRIPEEDEVIGEVAATFQVAITIDETT